MVTVNLVSIMFFLWRLKRKLVDSWELGISDHRAHKVLKKGIKIYTTWVNLYEKFCGGETVWISI